MKRTFVSALLFALIAAGLFSLFNTKSEEAELFAFDTYVSFSVEGKDAKEAKNEIAEEIKRLDEALNVNGTGALYDYNSGGEPEGEIKELLERSKSVSEMTSGAFDVTLYPVSKLWGFTTGEKRVPGESEIKEALKLTGYEKIGNGHPEADFGAAAKGYAADRIKEILKERKIKSAVASIGGTVLVYGKKALIAVKDPECEGYAATLECRDEVLSTSGSYERFFTENGKTYSHIIDPETGSPAESKIVSATALSKDGFLSDALSTAFFVMGEEKAKAYLKENKDVGAVLITDDGRLMATDNVTIKDYDNKYKLEII